MAREGKSKHFGPITLTLGGILLIAIIVAVIFSVLSSEPVQPVKVGIYNEPPQIIQESEPQVEVREVITEELEPVEEELSEEAQRIDELNALRIRTNSYIEDEEKFLFLGTKDFHFDVINEELSFTIVQNEEITGAKDFSLIGAQLWIHSIPKEEYPGVNSWTENGVEYNQILGGYPREGWVMNNAGSRKWYPGFGIDINQNNCIQGCSGSLLRSTNFNLVENQIILDATGIIHPLGIRHIGRKQLLVKHPTIPYNYSNPNFPSTVNSYVYLTVPTRQGLAPNWTISETLNIDELILSTTLEHCKSIVIQENAQNRIPQDKDVFLFELTKSTPTKTWENKVSGQDIGYFSGFNGNTYNYPHEFFDQVSWVSNAYYLYNWDGNSPEGFCPQPKDLLDYLCVTNVTNLVPGVDSSNCNWDSLGDSGMFWEQAIL